MKKTKRKGDRKRKIEREREKEKHIELRAKLLDYLLRSNKSNF